MKQKKKHFKRKKFLLLVIIFGTIVYLFLSQNSTKYLIINEKANANYDGIGQETILNKDGYFTTFTTQETHAKTFLEYKQNGTSSWSKHIYWGGTMEENGCGITAISIILSGYHQNYTPEDLRKKYQPVLKAENISKELSSTFGIENSNFYYDTSHLSKESIIQHLETNRPILICVWNQTGKNRWTEKSHYMVLLATDKQDKVYVSNPNGLENTSKSSGWYPISEITPYLAKALYIESY